MDDIDILVVEDEPSIREVVALYLERAGFKARCVEDGDSALEEFESNTPDLVIMDLMLPGIDGLTLTRYIREQAETPIIMLTARREEADRIVGLEMGADDYVVKPFSPQELVSRVRAVLRRTHGPSMQAGSKPLDYDHLFIDPSTRSVLAREEQVDLTAKEFDLLYYLAGHPRQVFNRHQLLDKVWGLAEYIDPSTVTVHVRRLREKIESNPSEPAWIMTVWGVGYKFEP